MDVNANLGIAFEGFKSVSLILILLPVHLEEEGTRKQTNKQTNKSPRSPSISITMRQWIKPAAPASVKHIQNLFAHSKVSSSGPPKDYNLLLQTIN